MSIELHTVDNGNVQAINDGRLYGEFTGNVGGIVNGSVVTSAGGLALHVTSGWGIGYGRVFTITADDYTVQPASSGTQKGRLYVHIDITQPANPIEIRSVAAASLPALVQDNLSEGGAIYEIELAHYDVTALAVSNLVSNTKVKFAGHAGEASNALKLGGISANNYVVYSNLDELMKIVSFSSSAASHRYRFTGYAGTRETCITLLITGQSQTAEAVQIMFGGNSGRQNLENTTVNLSTTLNGLISASGNSITIGRYGGDYGRHRFILLGAPEVIITQET